MKMSIIFAPQWTSMSPHCAPLVLAGELKKAGQQVTVTDLNLQFYDEVLTPQSLNNAVKKLAQEKGNLQTFLKENFEEQKSIEDYTEEFKLKVRKFNLICEIEKIKPEILTDIINFAPRAKEIMQSKTDFYNLNKLQSALFTIEKCLNLVSAAYFPWDFSMHDYLNYYFKFTYENILKEVQDNMFCGFFEGKIGKILDGEADAYAFSISSSSQLIPTLTLSSMMKSRTGKPIVIGGNYISRITDTLLKTPEFFEDFTDYVIYEEGERAISELCEYFEGKRSLEAVSSLIYKRAEKVIKNKKELPLKLNDTAIHNLDGYELDKYFLPEIVLPMQASRGCYWKKCTFCDHDFGQTYNVKNPDKLVSEIEELQKRYGISYFEFVDEAISANNLKNMSEKILERNLKINWYCNCRLEDTLTEDILRTARKAGLRMILWGYESGSERISELINKGVDIDKRLEIFARANNADIWNFAYIFFGFPTETVAEASETAEIIYNNTDIIPSFGRSAFTLGKHALMRKYPAQFKIEALREDIEPFSSNLSYTMASGLQGQALNDWMNEFTRKAMIAYGFPAWATIKYRESLFLYICKYTMNEVKKMKSPTVIK